ncbi:DUF1015 domain-containing protein [Chondrinema litorale]|uniref:DUF1015 domain-containing protein n=1 Tax=Chondrinema litorale TaxID=2994555 RepID=UPI002542DF22|nr:DUF1015 domain-containing protein [Chondrinema litorale]UZR93737.1 DUF1015 domain-containing protein [Chondrinema litorale]
MAEIKPFRAWRYHPRFTENIDKLIAPLFDVISEKQRKQLYNEPYNSMHLSVPLGENPAREALKSLNSWKENEVIVQDEVESIYVYFQYFYLPNDPVKHCRKGFICMIKAYDYAENVILRHENTMPHSVNDRISLLEATKLNVSPTHGLYTDPAFTLEKYMDEAMENPVYQIEDYQGVTDALAIITDKSIIQEFKELILDRQIILADGHHRYEGSLQYKKKKQKIGVSQNGNEAFNYHMMFLTNTEAHNLRILPTHRIINNYPSFNTGDLLIKAAEFFNIKEVDDPMCLNEIIIGKQWTFGLILKNRACIIKLKPELIEKIDWKFPDAIKKLDLTVLHYFFIEKVLGILGKDQRKNNNINFERNFLACYTAVNSNNADIALITNEISIDDVKKVCFSGFTLPQKSTYFYPKVISGFLFGSVNE